MAVPLYGARRDRTELPVTIKNLPPFQTLEMSAIFNEKFQPVTTEVY